MEFGWGPRVVQDAGFLQAIPACTQMPDPRKQPESDLDRDVPG